MFDAEHHRIKNQKVTSVREITWLVTLVSFGQVTSPYGNQLHYQENVQSGQFAFTTSESGNFMACFWLTNAPPNAAVNVALDWKTGVAAKDWASIAKKDKLDVLS